MSETTEAAAPHPTDGDLVRLLDGETEDPALEEHLEACDGCRRRYRRIAGWSREVGRALDAVDPLVAERAAADRETDAAGTGVRRWMRVAAGVVVLVSAGLAFQPVRAWVVDRAERVARHLGLVERTGREAGAGESGASIAFVPEGRRLLIQVEAPQAEGKLEVVAGRGDGRVRASVVGREADAEDPAPAFAAFPSELRIRNGTGSGASYRVSVPASLEELEIRVGGRRLARLAGGGLTPGATRTWPLRAAETRPEDD